MAKVSFAKPGGTSLVQEAPPAATATPETPSAAPAASLGVPAVVPPSAPPAFFNDENMDPGDLQLPRLSIVQKVGELSTQFSSGAIVLGGQLVLADAPKGEAESTPVDILVLGLQPTKFSEKVEGGLRGNLFDTEAAVVAAGGTLDWNESKATDKPLYQRVVTGLVLIKRPDGLDEGSFPNEIDGQRYSLALYTMKGTSYTQAARPMKTARKLGHHMAKKEWSDNYRTVGHRGGFWTVTSKMKKTGQNIYYIPIVRPSNASTEVLRAGIQELLGF